MNYSNMRHQIGSPITTEEEDSITPCRLGWMIEVLEDLRQFAELNQVPLLEEELTYFRDRMKMMIALEDLVVVPRGLSPLSGPV